MGWVGFPLSPTLQCCHSTHVQEDFGIYLVFKTYLSTHLSTVCSACDYNRADNSNRCKRSLEWQWRGELFAMKRSEFYNVLSTIQREEVPVSRVGAQRVSLGMGTALRAAVCIYIFPCRRLLSFPFAFLFLFLLFAFLLFPFAFCLSQVFYSGFGLTLVPPPNPNPPPPPS